MKYVSVADFKAKLSSYLKGVKEGESIYVTSHGHPVAQVVPMAEAPELNIRPPDRPVEGIKSIQGVSIHEDLHLDELLRRDRDRR